LPLLSLRSLPAPRPTAASARARSVTAQELAPLHPSPGVSAARPRLFAACANPGCGSGWLHLWRNRSVPIFEGGWSCSPECTVSLVRWAVRRELDGRALSEPAHRHRVPLGLLMVEQGWITTRQLRRALEAQRAAGSGRLGQWLIGVDGVSEQLVTRALSVQWSCPVLVPDFHDPEALAPLIPRLFLDAFAALPLRVAGGRLLYLGFEDRLDPVLALAVERVAALRVETGVVRASLFRPAHARMLSVTFPSIELIEAASEPAAASALAKSVERARPVEARLARVHDCLWLRMWLKPQAGPLPELDQVQDVICAIGRF
jgi:hypothetical protein